jgi:hypothetical protein
MTEQKKKPGRPARELSRAEKIAKKREERVVVNHHRSKLTLPDGVKEEGWSYRWVNDSGTRIYDRKKQGWEFVTAPDGMDVGQDLTTGGNTDLGTQISTHVGNNAKGDPIIAYLMRIEDELYQEDQAAKQQKVQSVEDQITGSNKTKEQAQSEGGTTYQEAKISHGKLQA